MITNIHHAEDPDGIISAALLQRYQQTALGNSVLQASLVPKSINVPARYDRLVESFSSLLEVVQKENISPVYVADINPNPHLMKSGLVEQLAQAAEIHWIDHHTGTEQQQEYFSKMGIQVTYDATKCASLLLVRTLNLTSPYLQRLAKIAQLHDYHSNSKDTDSPEAKLGVELEKIICLANAHEDAFILRRLIEDLSVGSCFYEDELQPQWRHLANEYDHEKVNALRGLENSIELVKVKNYQVLIAHAPALLSQKPAIWYLKQKDPDILVCFFQPPCRNHILDKRKDVPLDVPALCTAFGGGGRGTGGGFSVSEDLTPERYVQLKEQILQKIETGLPAVSE